MSLPLTLPVPVQKFFARFPLYTHPPVHVQSRYLIDNPALWIAPPRLPQRDSLSDLLSADVECLKWQAYLALRGVANITVRWDISPEGAIDGRLPNLHLPGTPSQILAPHNIPGWVDTYLGTPVDPLEGYRDQQAKDESHAWVSLLEGIVHVALSFSQPTPSYLSKLFQSNARKSRPLETVLNPPPPPLTGFSSIVPAFGMNVEPSALLSRYTEAITSLSERLGTDRWFLGSENPTALDALAFAYLHCILNNTDTIRIHVARHVNLVFWERRVRAQVQPAFCLPTRSS